MCTYFSGIHILAVLALNLVIILEYADMCHTNIYCHLKNQADALIYEYANKY